MNSKETWRLELYRSLHIRCVEPWLLPWLMPKDRLSEGSESLTSLENLTSRGSESLAWFHAASVGELESIWSIIDQWLTKGRDAVVTVFSSSAKSQIRKLREEMSSRPGRILFSGYSPWEGRWGQILRRIRPKVFVTAKYEAWPELWVSLEMNKIPLVIVGARARRSIQLARQACRWLGGAAPELYFSTVLSEDSDELKAEFPSAKVRELGDPRWDRVEERARIGSQRARDLVQTFSRFPRPWGMMGSIWQEDLQIWGSALGKADGTLWVIPHDLKQKNLEEIGETLRDEGLMPIFSSKVSDAFVPERDVRYCVVVDEMGVLLELYSKADWAFVGGGFGAGIHSTIEPAHYGIPVACGPKNADKFPETELLKGTGQLVLVSSSDEIAAWLSGTGQFTSEDKSVWSQQAAARMGAAGRVLGMMEAVCGVSG